jgi:DNA repair exonuclease SbcCD ATPase subunit
MKKEWTPKPSGNAEHRARLTTGTEARPPSRKWPIKRIRKQRITDQTSTASRDIVPRRLQDLKDGLRSQETQLRTSSHESARPGAEAAAVKAREGFAGTLAELLDQELPGSVNQQAKQLYQGDDTVRRWRKGEAVPAPDQLNAMIRRISEIRGQPVPAEQLARLLEAHEKALEVPRTLRERLEAAQAELGAAKTELAAMVERDQALADRAAALAEEIEMLERELARGWRRGGSHGRGSRQPSQNSDTQHEQELRARLVQAKQELKDFLRQQQENSEVLRKSAKNLIEAVESYLRLIRQL